MPLVIRGRMAPLNPGDPQASFPGSLYIRAHDGGTGDTHRVEEVRPAGQPAPAGFDDAPVVDVGDAFVYPGLLDLHSHVIYGALPLWTEPGRDEPFWHHNDWTNESTYSESITWPAWLLKDGAPEALMVYTQVRALAGGTTAIQGWPGASRKLHNELLRAVENEDFGTGERNLIRASVGRKSDEDLQKQAEHFGDGEGLIYHCAEGQVGSVVVNEYEDVRDHNCLRERLIAVHMNAVEDDAFRAWAQRSALAGDGDPGVVVWSPFSNLWLYGETTSVSAARQHGVGVCLGTDWAPSGTKNLLGELKVARLWSEHADLDLSAFELAQMVTATPGDVLAKCWRGRQAGRLVPDALADVAVIAARDQDPWENLVLAREEDVQLVVVDGRARLGIRDLMRDAGERRTTSVHIGGGHRRHTALIDPADPTKTWTWSRVVDALEDVGRAPERALARGEDALRALAGTPDAPEAPRPLYLELDMPGPGGLRAGPPPAGVDVAVPEPPSLRHDLPWRASVKDRGFHDGLLDELDRFYR